MVHSRIRIVRNKELACSTSSEQTLAAELALVPLLGSKAFTFNVEKGITLVITEYEIKALHIPEWDK